MAIRDSIKNINIFRCEINSSQIKLMPLGKIDRMFLHYHQMQCGRALNFYGLNEIYNLQGEKTIYLKDESRLENLYR